MRTTLPKKLMLSILFMTAYLGLNTLSLNAQPVVPSPSDTITFTWKGSTSEKMIPIAATSGKAFSINWGNGVTNNYSGAGDFDLYFQSTPYGDKNEYTVTITGGTDCSFTLISLSGQGVISLDVSSCTNLKNLDCSYNTNLTGLNLNRNVNLEKLDCTNSNLKNLDVSNNINLKELICNHNGLTSLDVSSNVKLENLSCYSNNLDSLDLRNNTDLVALNCAYNNSLKSLNVSNNTNLESLFCSNNLLTSLEVSGKTNLVTLDCSYSKLERLDVSGCTKLTSLTCSYSKLTALDLSGNTSLETLYCFENELDSLDVSESKYLTSLNCNSNNLSTLDVSTNTVLNILNCNFNKLTNLDLSTNTSLTYVACAVNALPLLNLKAISDITSIVQTSKYLGKQNLPVQDVGTYTPITIDSVYNGVNTTFNVTLNYMPADKDTDYTITDGKIIFLKPGDFRVSITNTNLISSEYSPAEVIAAFNVEETAPDSSLATLTLSAGTLNPAFDPAITDYTVNVNHYTTSITITATAKNIKTTITGAGTKKLNTGTNIFDIIVTTESGSTKTYKITVTREAAPVLSSDATLSDLRVSEGTLSPEFRSMLMDYTVIVGDDIEKIEINATTNDINASVEGTGVKKLIVGENPFSLIVTAEDGSWARYDIIITRGSNPTGIESIDTKAIQIYPNPVTDYVLIKGITQPALVSVYSIQGTALLQREVQPEEAIYVGNLSSGIYLIKVDGKTFKVLKR